MERNPISRPSAASSAEQLVAPLMPPGAAWALTEWGAEQNAASERELALVARAVAKRRAEFVAGRSAARAALARFGLGTTELLAGKHREPLWPSGIVGSITHAGGVAAAVAAESHTIEAIGLDLEVLSRDSLPVEVVICPAERRAFAALVEELGPSAFFVYFSAKEAVFKAMYPRHRRYFDFLDVALETVDGGSFRARPLPGAPRDSDWSRLQVAWLADQRFVVSLAWLGPAG